MIFFSSFPKRSYYNHIEQQYFSGFFKIHYTIFLLCSYPLLSGYISQLSIQNYFCLGDVPEQDLSYDSRDELPSAGAQSLCLKSTSDAHCDMPQDCHQLLTMDTYLHQFVIPLPHPGGKHLSFAVSQSWYVANLCTCTQESVCIPSPVIQTLAT